jgi:RNA polymerase sigma-70 factor (ECF subfamily)
MGSYLEGDMQAFRALFARHTPSIYGFLLHRTGDRALAEDLTQQTWLRVHAARHTFQRGARLRPWLYTIAANLRRDEYRGRPREEMTRDGTLPEPPVQRDPAEAGEQRDLLHRALAALPELYRDVIVLHRFHDMGFAQIAQVLGATEGAVKLRAHRGYLLLRERLGKERPA